MVPRFHLRRRLVSCLLHWSCFLFFLHRPPTPQISTLSLHDALPISRWPELRAAAACGFQALSRGRGQSATAETGGVRVRSEEHTSELQSLRHLVCRLLLEKKKKKNTLTTSRK